MAALLRLCLVLLVLALPGRAALAQDQASLVADTLRIENEAVLVAEGNVEIFYQGRRLKARLVRYDRRADRLTIEGPITLTDGAGTILVADQADLAADLTEGVLTSARLVLNDQLQLAAARVLTVGGRYAQLDRVVASSCKVCEGDPTPLWEIRARRVTHDRQERQIYFDRAQLRFGGVPVLYVPRLRLPDPTLTRATGFLTPVIRSTSELGAGVKLPYFVRIGDHADLTLTPFLSSKSGRSVELRFRRAFRTGEIELRGGLARDDIQPGLRSFGKITGAFLLPGAFRLSFQAEGTSDKAYLQDYGISDQDRLASRIEITRTRRNEFIQGRLLNFDTLRDDEDPDTLPFQIADLTYHRRFSLGPFGGEGGFRLQTHAHERASTLAVDGPDPDAVADGRDMSRVSLRLDWRRSWLFASGIEATLAGELGADAYSVRQDATFAGNRTRASSIVSAELRWPFVKTTGTGVTHVLEPVVQLVWAPENDLVLPNEDSTLVEFDEGNLFALDRFPGADATEKGRRINAGLTWTRLDPTGWTMGVTVGRVFRERDLGQFGPATGLQGGTSDWLLASQLTAANGYGMTGRVLFDDGLSASKAEVTLRVDRPRFGMSTSYLWAEADPDENRPDRTSELLVDAAVKLSPGWTGKLIGRYDFEADRGTVAGMGLAFRNECLLVDLSLSRRFTSSTSVTPTTSFDLSVELLGFGSRGTAGPARVCRG